ncbi:MAG: YgiQ family radical SAM protein, partial [Clostridia bacterium]|nr:YgiQ family radical SAM protein [Clostridia bacterium]
KKRRSEDYYSPEKKAGLRPDRAVIVYCNRIREAYGDIPIIIGGVEASLRRFAHYDYWDDKVRRSILIDSGADILSYGMGEKSIPEIAKLLDKGVPVKKIRDVRGTVVCTEREYQPKFPYIDTYSYDELKTDKEKYAKSFAIQYKNTDPTDGKAVTEFYDGKKIVQNPPQPLLTRQEMDEVYALEFTRTWHPMYDKCGGISAIDEVEFSITHNRGCFGGCAFCAIAFHQGRNVVSRSKESVLAEARLLTTLKGFKGYIHDVGGPTANFRYGPCKAVRDGKKGVCKNRRCLAPEPCKNLLVDHSEYVEILEEMSKIPKIKKVFVRSGVRFDYAIYDKSDAFIKRLVKYHVSGQLKVAPEHISDKVLSYMGKPSVKVYERFCDKYFSECKKASLEQYLVPYLMSSHPGSTINEAIDLALYLKKKNIRPEQVQDFYPTPGTAATTMYYTGIDPFTLKQVYVPKTYEEKKLQRALLQSSRAENRPLVEKAIRISDRRDAQCLLGHFPVSDNAHKVRKTGMKTASNQKPKKKGGVKKGKGSDIAKLRKALKEKSKIKSK